MTPTVLYLDNHLLVVAKPAGMLVQGDATGDTDLLTWGKAYLKRRFDKPGAVFLGLVHRLDRPTSGVVALARTSKAASRLAAQFRAREPDKRYLALVEGRLDGAGEAEDWLAKDHRRTRVVAPEHPAAKHARLRWQALETDGQHSLVAVKLLTGRAHQIRVQLAALGHPLVGDFRYGTTTAFDGRNLALHAAALRVEHPTLRRPVAFRAPPPPAWNAHFPAAVRRYLDTLPPSEPSPLPSDGPA
jgi:RluA family pseudouridine synthase